MTAIRCTEFEVIAEDAKLYRDKFKQLGEVIQQLTNFLWDEWRAHHHAAGHIEKIREWEAKWTEYKRSGGDKPEKHGIKPVDSDLGKTLYHQARRIWPTLATRTLSLTMKCWNARVGKLKSAHGSYPGWHSVLLYRQQMPSSVHPLPVPFNKTNAVLIPPLDDKDHFAFELRLESIEGTGKRPKLKTIKLRLWDKGRAMRGRVELLKSIMRGEIKFNGSSVVWKRGKLFVSVAHQIAEKTKVKGDVTATFTPERDRPASLAWNDQVKWIGGRGDVVIMTRRRLLNQRWSRQQSYRQAPTTNRKGHGRNRAMGAVTKLTRLWRDFVRTYNQQMVAHVVRLCQANGIVVIEFERRDTTKLYLTNAGKMGDRDSSGWEWFQLEKMLRDKLQEIGVTLKLIDHEELNDKAGQELETVD